MKFSIANHAVVLMVLLVSLLLFSACSSDSPTTIQIEFNDFFSDTHSILSVSAGIESNYIVLSDGSLWGWGWFLPNLQDRGQVLSNQLFHAAPIHLLDNVLAVSGSTRHLFVITDDNSLWGWGENSLGQLGDGTLANRSYKVHIMDDVTAVSTNVHSSLALLEDGTLWAWGIGRRTPQEIERNVIAIAVGPSLSYFVTNDYELWSFCLTNETTEFVMEDVRAVSSDGDSTYVITLDNTLLLLGEPSSLILENALHVSASDANVMVATTNGYLLSLGHYLRGHVTWDFNDYGVKTIPDTVINPDGFIPRSRVLLGTWQLIDTNNAIHLPHLGNRDDLLEFHFDSSENVQRTTRMAGEFQLLNSSTDLEWRVTEDTMLEIENNGLFQFEIISNVNSRGRYDTLTLIKDSTYYSVFIRNRPYYATLPEM